MRKKSIITLIVMLTMLFAFGALNASASTLVANGVCGDNVIWNLDNEGVLTISGSGQMDDFYWVDPGFEAPWYQYHNSIKSVVFKGNITRIGDYAFKYCSAVSSIIIPDSVEEIGNEAFYCCSELISITIGENVTSIESASFAGCASLEKIVWNSKLSQDFSFSSRLFGDIGENGNGVSVVFGDNVKRIPAYIFYGNENIQDVIISGSVETIGNDAFSYCKNLSEVTIGDNVSAIESNAFLGCCSLDKVELPDSVESLGFAAFMGCSKMKSIRLSNNLKTIDDYAFDTCVSVSELVIPNSVVSIGKKVFWGWDDLQKVYYNGSEEEWSVITNGNLYDVSIIYFYYVNLIYESGEKKVHMGVADMPINYDIIDIVVQHSPILYTDKDLTIEFPKALPLTSNIDIYVKYKLNQYTYAFVDDNGDLIKEETIDFGSKIIPPTDPIKSATQQFTYTFAGWSGYTEGMTIENDITFTATYSKTTNQYTYSFVDDNGSVLKKVTVDYGTSITPPAMPTDREPYEFEYWDSYIAGMKITKDITFTAVYKYKNYVITAEGVSEPITATYNSNFVINPQYKDGYNFIGYFTEKNGNGNQITNENGESLSPYNVVGNMNVYPYFYSQYVNKIELQGTTSATLGDTITQKAIFATDKNTMYLTTTIKYPKYLEFKDIKGVDFVEASEEPEKTVDDFKYLDITCLYNYLGESIPVNTNLVPFEIEFVVAADAKIGNTEIAIENVLLSGATNYNIVDITNNTLEIKAKLAESIEITGEDSVDKPTQFNTIISPDYATNKSVVWSVDDETVATVSQNGVVTPIKNGSITLTATTADGSGLSAKKTIEISAYAKIDSLDFGNGIVLKEFNADVREYIVYVREDATSITLTPTFSGGGVLRANGSGIWVSNSPKIFEITEEEPAIITLNRENVTDMTNSVYTIKVVKFEGTKSEVFNNDKTFKIVPINIETGKLVILALYDNKQLVDIQKTTNTGEEITFTTSKTYTNAKVMVWDDFKTLRPVCNAEIVK